MMIPANVMSFPAGLHHPATTNPPPESTMLPHCPPPIADLAQMLALQVQNQQRRAFQHHLMVEEQARQQEEQAKQQQAMLSLLNNLIRAQGESDGISATLNLQTHSTPDSAVKKKEAVQCGEILVEEYAKNAHSDTIDSQLLSVLQKQSFTPLNPPSSSKNLSANPQVDGLTYPSHSSENNVYNKEVSPPSVPEKNLQTSSPMVVVGGIDGDLLAPKNCSKLLPSSSFSAQGTSQCPTLNLSTSAPIAAVAVHSNVNQNAATVVPITTDISTTKPSYASLLKPKAIPPVIPVTQLPIPYKKGHLMAVKLDEAVYQRSLKSCNNNLHGRLILARGRAPIKAVDLHFSLSNVWQTKDHWSLTPIGRGYYTIRFSNVDDKHKVWASGQTTIKEGTFNLFQWTKDFKPSKQKQSRAHVWARLHEVPEEYMHFHLLMSMANVIGHPVTIDPFTLKKEFGHYCRVKVDVDLKSELPSSILVEREGFNFEIEVSYERIPEFCSHCSVIGHLVTACRTLKKVQQQQEQPSKPPSKTNNIPKTKHTKHIQPVIIKTTSSTPFVPPNNVASTSATVNAEVNAPHTNYPPIGLNPTIPFSPEQQPIQHYSEPTQANNLTISQQKALINAGLMVTPSTVTSTPFTLSPADTVVPYSADNCHTPSPPHNDNLPIYSPPSPPLTAVHNVSSQNASCKFTKSRHYNKYSPLSEHLFDDDGEGEDWDNSSTENLMDNQDQKSEHVGYYSPAGSNQYTVVSRPPVLNVHEALNWGNMADEAPFQSWEARADAEFEAAIAPNIQQEEGVQLVQDNRSTTLEQEFPPLQVPYNSCPNSSSHSVEYVPSPLQTRAQRLNKKGTSSVPPLHNQKKQSKAAKREANALLKKKEEAAATVAIQEKAIKSINEVSHVNEGWKVTLHPQPHPSNVADSSNDAKTPHKGA